MLQIKVMPGHKVKLYKLIDYIKTVYFCPLPLIFQNRSFRISWLVLLKNQERRGKSQRLQKDQEATRNTLEIKPINRNQWVDPDQRKKEREKELRLRKRSVSSQDV